MFWIGVIAGIGAVGIGFLTAIVVIAAGKITKQENGNHQKK